MINQLSWASIPSRAAPLDPIKQIPIKFKSHFLKSRFVIFFFLIIVSTVGSLVSLSATSTLLLNKPILDGGQKFLQILVLCHFDLSEEAGSFLSLLRTTFVIVRLVQVLLRRFHFLFLINQSSADTHHCTQPDLDPSVPPVNHVLQCKSPWIQTVHIHRVQPLLLTCPVEPVWTPCNCFQLHVCLCTGIWDEPPSCTVFTNHDPCVLCSCVTFSLSPALSLGLRSLAHHL